MCYHFLVPEGGHPTWEEHFIEKKQSAHEKILVGYFYVRKVANKAKSPFNFIGLNLILSVLAPLICKWGLFIYNFGWFFGNSK